MFRKLISFLIIFLSYSNQPLTALSPLQNSQLLLTQRSQNRVDTLFNQAIEKAVQGDLSGAISDFTEVINLNPNHADAYNNRGYLYKELKEYKKALSDYNKAIEINPNSADFYSNRGILHYTQKHYNEAITDYNQAVTLDKNYWPALTNIGLIKYEQGAVDEAISKFQQAVNINHETAEPLLALAVAFSTQGEEEKALELAQSALKLDKRFGDIEFLKENNWGEKLITDAQKLLSNPQIQTLIN